MHCFQPSNAVNSARVKFLQEILVVTLPCATMNRPLYMRDAAVISPVQPSHDPAPPFPCQSFFPLRCESANRQLVIPRGLRVASQPARYLPMYGVIVVQMQNEPPASFGSDGKKRRMRKGEGFLIKAFLLCFMLLCIIFHTLHTVSYLQLGRDLGSTGSIWDSSGDLVFLRLLISLQRPRGIFLLALGSESPHNGRFHQVRTDTPQSIRCIAVQHIPKQIPRELQPWPCRARASSP